MAKGDAGQGQQGMPPSIMQQQGIKSINFHPGQGPLAPSGNNMQPSNIGMAQGPMQGMTPFLGSGGQSMGNAMPINGAGAAQSPVAPSNPQDLIRRIMMGQQSQ